MTVHLSIFDMFKIGIGPSSSHTVGPMLAARDFTVALASGDRLAETHAVRAELYGSLALTGRGHGTDTAVLLGLSGERPDEVDPDRVPAILSAIRAGNEIRLLGSHRIEFREDSDLVFHFDESLPMHSNGMRFTAFARDGNELLSDNWYSVGGGFIVRGDQPGAATGEERQVPPWPFATGAELLARADEAGLPLHGLMLENEKAWRAETEIRAGIDRIWEAMKGSIERGLSREGPLPGRLAVQRRAARLGRELSRRGRSSDFDVMDWVNAFAMAVNEENAAGGRIVTAPTNGAAGILPAVALYYERYAPGADREGIHRFLLTAGAIGMLYKRNASISGAEMGCQGEVGVACSMAAAGLVAALGGSNMQQENAAEIGMEHNLGLTCDPVGGLVQIPCIERNAMGAVKAINAARISMLGDGTHKVSLDQVIATMRQTGQDMSSIYKETSRGGLAVNVPEC